MKSKRYLLAALVMALAVLVMAACETQTVEVQVTRVVDVTATPRVMTFHDAAAIESETCASSVSAFGSTSHRILPALATGIH